MKIIFSFLLLLLSYTGFSQGYIKPYDFYDMDGLHQDEFGSGFQFWNWFQGIYINDPVNHAPDMDTVGFYKVATATRSYNYPKGYKANGTDTLRGDRGMRIIVNLVNEKNRLKLPQYHITKVCGLQQGGDGQDTLIGYIVDYALSLPRGPARDACFARPDSLLPVAFKLPQYDPITYKPMWKVLTTNFNARYIMLSIKQKQHYDGGGNPIYTSLPVFSELAFYGVKLFADDTIVPRLPYTGAMPKTKTFDNWHGVDDVGAFASATKHDHAKREYEQSNNIDTSYGEYGTARWRVRANRYGDDTVFLFTNFRDQIRDHGAFIWLSEKGGGNHLALHNGLNPGNCVPVTTYGMEPESRLSYDRIASVARHDVALMGNNSAHTDAEFKWGPDKSTLPGYGLGMISAYEDGNEDEFRGQTTLSYVLRSFREYDSIKSADPNMPFMMAATVGLDTNRYKTMIWLADVLGGYIPWDIFNGHHYSRTNGFSLQRDPTIEELVGVHGQTPEIDKIRMRIEDTRNVIYREIGDTSKKFVVTEIGYDNFDSVSTTVDQMNYPWTTDGVPKMAGYTALQAKSIMMARTESIMSSIEGLFFMNEYMITNIFYNSSNASPVQFATSGRAGADGIVDNRLLPTKFDNWYGRGSRDTRLKNWRATTGMTESATGLNRLELTNILYPDSVCIVVWKGTLDTSKLYNVPINYGDTLVGNVNCWDMSFSNTSGTTSLRAQTDNQIFTTVEARPRWYFAQVNGGGEGLPPDGPLNPSQYFLRKKHKPLYFKQ